jgi:hypothetical protein
VLGSDSLIFVPHDNTKYDASNPTGYITAGAVPTGSSSTPAMDGIAAAGTQPSWARGDHVHPSDTSRLSKVGVTDGSAAPAGQIGEVLSSIQTTPQALVSTTPKAVTTLPLTAGDWDVQGEVWIAAGTGAPTVTAAAINTAVAIPAAVALGVAARQISAAIAASSTVVMPLTPCRVNITSPTTYNLVAQATFPSGTTNATGKIWARRAR